MKFSTDRETLLRPLQLVNGVVERRQTLPVLANLLVVAKDGVLSLTGTDLEVELRCRTSEVDIKTEGEATLPARKLADIWRSLPDGSSVSVEIKADRAIVKSGRSRFTLATLPVADFPSIDSGPGNIELTMQQGDLRRLLDRVSFSMAQQDVRYFLNGMLLEVSGEHTRTVATDGHRLAMCTLPANNSGNGVTHAIIPRKGVIELSRLLDDKDETISVRLGSNHLTVSREGYELTTKLVDGKFPEYDKVIPRDSSRSMVADRETLRQSCQRASILSNEKYRGVRLLLDNDQLTIQANNPEQEEAEEVVAVEYTGDHLEIGFNVSYLQEILGVLGTDQVRISVSDANSSALVEGPGNDDAVYVVMPMRL